MTFSGVPVPAKSPFLGIVQCKYPPAAGDALDKWAPVAGFGETGPGVDLGTNENPLPAVRFYLGFGFTYS